MIDPLIVKRCQAQEEEAFELLYKAVVKKAVWTAYLTMGSMGSAEDIVQEALFECFRDICKLSNPELFQAWFNKILIRKCWDRIKKHRKQSEESLDDGKYDLLNDCSEVFETVHTKYMNSVIRKSVNNLKPEMRATVVLYYYNDFSIKEIAKIMSCYQGTVKSRLHYAKKVLEKDLKGDISENRGDTSYSVKKGVIADE